MLLVLPESLRDIRRLQRSTKLLVGKCPVPRAVRDVNDEIKPDMRWSADALECVYEASKAFLTRYLEDANSAAIHGGRATLMQKDMILLKNLRMRHGVFPGAYTGIENNRLYKSPRFE